MLAIWFSTVSLRNQLQSFRSSAGILYTASLKSFHVRSLMEFPLIRRKPIWFNTPLLAAAERKDILEG
jgi:hypothetical protein